MALRALIAKDRQTTVEVTTGQFDSTEPGTGTIKNLQLKSFKRNGGVAWSKNYNSVEASTFSAVFRELHRGQPLQARALVRDLNQRSGVVRVNATVQRRPDLALTDLVVPAQATAWQPILIAASVSELNGDIGALGNCNLLIDGSFVEQVPSIYVDAADTVSCVFSRGFGTLGTHSIEVNVDGVTPGDWDMANNSAQTSIEILPASAATTWVARASHLYEDSANLDEGWFRNTNGSYTSQVDWRNESSTNSEQLTFFFDAFTPVPVTFPLQVLATQLSADGAVVGDQVYTDVPADFSWGDASDGGDTLTLYDEATATFTYVTNLRQAGQGMTEVHHNRFAGTVVYFSSEYNRQWDSDGNDTTYSWNQSGSSTSGVLWSLSESMSLDFHLIDATGFEMQAMPVVTLEPYSTGFDNPYTCTDTEWSTGAQHVCSSSHDLVTGVSGLATGEN